jgi:hypothetical protein
MSAARVDPVPEVSGMSAIRARCDAATDGPWEYVEGNKIVVAGLERHSPGHISYDTLIVEVDGGEPGLDETESAYAARVEANASFVAAARTDVAALLDLVEQQAAENVRLRAAATRGADALDTLIYDSSDPGTEALGARWELRHATGTARVDPVPEVSGSAVIKARWMRTDAGRRHGPRQRHTDG